MEGGPLTTGNGVAADGQVVLRIGRCGMVPRHDDGLVGVVLDVLLENASRVTQCGPDLLLADRRRFGQLPVAAKKGPLPTSTAWRRDAVRETAGIRAGPQPTNAAADISVLTPVDRSNTRLRQ